MIYVHIGAGAGDLDKGANLRDGFSEFVKQSKDNDKRIYVVEANPSNISKLIESWKNYKNVKIFNFAVSSSSYDEKKIKFYYSLDDAPHYQQFSNDIEHIKKSISTHFNKNKQMHGFRDTDGSAIILFLIHFVYLGQMDCTKRINEEFLRP